MGKGSRLRKLKKKKVPGFEEVFSDRLTENFQKRLRHSGVWDQMVEEFGEEKAKQLLKECKAEIKPGVDIP